MIPCLEKYVHELTPDTVYDFVYETHKRQYQDKTVMHTEHPFNTNMTCGCIIFSQIIEPNSVELTYYTDDTNYNHIANITLASTDKCRQDIELFIANVKSNLKAELFKQKAYELYQFNWLMTHGFTLANIYMRAKSMESYDAFIDAGFDDENGIFASKNEFLNNEFKDMHFMKNLFKNQPNSEQLIKAYHDATGYSLDAIPELEIPTTAGILKAYKCDVVNTPGIIVQLQPEGYTDNFDVAATLVYETPDAISAGIPDSENITPKDVRIVIWGDATKDDYTEAKTIKRTDIEQGFATDTSNV